MNNFNMVLKGKIKMKEESGVTLSALIIYIVIMAMVIVVMSSVTAMFYTNVNGLEANSDEIIKFSEFNNYFVKEIKSPNNAIDSIAENGKYILFKSGNSFSYKNNEIYYNNLKIVSNVNNMSFSYYNGQNNNDDIVTVNIEFEKYTKQINYKVEEIY